MSFSRPATGSVLDLIGHTPIVELHGFDTGCCRLFVKLESQNPGGSIKDRIGRSMIEAAERSGKLRPGSTLIEATAGNTGLGLALVAAQKGYRLLLVMPDKMSQEKVLHLRAMGAEVVWTRSDVGAGHPEYYQDLARRIADETPNSFFVDQFNNPANPLAHETTTGPEIWEQMSGDVDAVVCGVGSGGTITGLSRYFERVAPHLELVLADPKGSILAEYIRTGVVGEAGSWLVEGIGEDFLPAVADFSRVRTAYTITDEESFATVQKLLETNGLLAGSSSGTLIAAALRYCRDQTEPKRVVTFVCDSGNKYLSRAFNPHWLTDIGLIGKPEYNDLRDFVSRRFDQREVTFVSPDDTVARAATLLRTYDISQLPVMDGETIVGLVDESDLLLAAAGEPGGFGASVRDVMSSNLLVLSPDDRFDALVRVLQSGMVAILCDGPRFIGLITRIDLLNHYRRQQRRPAGEETKG
jgi:cystathionine beta-synthase